MNDYVKGSLLMVPVCLVCFWAGDALSNKKAPEIKVQSPERLEQYVDTDVLNEAFKDTSRDMYAKLAARIGVLEQQQQEFQLKDAELEMRLETHEAWEERMLGMKPPAR
jgi:hypothetical protein